MKNTILITLLFGLAFFFGCGPELTPDWEKTYPCTVTVTWGGKPKENVTVYLERVENHGSWAVMGTTNASGVAEISTSWMKASVKGSPAGTFKVSMSMPAPPFKSKTIPDVSPEELQAMHPAERERRAAALRAEVERWRDTSPDFLPMDLMDSNKSPVRIEVVPGTPATLTIEVEDYRKK